MANIPIWSGTATFNSSLSPTAFGFYDDDGEFATDAPNVAKWCAQRLGYPLIDIELQDINFFTAFEESVTEYGTQVYQFQVINNIGNLIGYGTGSNNDTIDEDTGEIIKAEGFNNIIVSNVYGATSNTQDNSSYSTALADSKIYSASLHVKRGKQKYNLLSEAPGYASTTLEWGANADDASGTQVFGDLDHSASIAITDTNGVTVHYRATTGSSAGGYNLGVESENPTIHNAPNMVTGSGEFRRYRHISASAGEFATGSYEGVSLGLPRADGSAQQGSTGISTLSASFDSFISTLEIGPHNNTFTLSSSLSSSGAHFLKITQNVEGTGGNTTITVNNMPGVTASAAFTGGSSGVSFEVSGSQIQARTKRISIEKIYHYSPAAINRYFDPYAGTGTGIQSLMQTFGFGNFSPGVNFMLMPMYFDALKLQAIEMNDTIRKSAYHFELNGRNLKLFPIPTSDYTLWFDYTMANSSNDLTTGAGHATGDVDDDEDFPKDLITDQSNVPYKNPTYSFINAIGRQWIRKYTLALCKEMLGSIRGKYQSVPIPGSETTLDYSRLLSEAAAEKEALITQLRDDLDLTTTVSQNERQSNEANFKQSTAQADDPYQIYIH